MIIGIFTNDGVSHNHLSVSMFGHNSAFADLALCFDHWFFYQ